MAVDFFFFEIVISFLCLFMSGFVGISKTRYPEKYLSLLTSLLAKDKSIGRH